MKRGITKAGLENPNDGYFDRIYEMQKDDPKKPDAYKILCFRQLARVQDIVLSEKRRYNNGKE